MLTIRFAGCGAELSGQVEMEPGERYERVGMVSKISDDTKIGRVADSKGGYLRAQRDFDQIVNGPRRESKTMEHKVKGERFKRVRRGNVFMQRVVRGWNKVGKVIMGNKEMAEELMTDSIPELQENQGRGECSDINKEIMLGKLNCLKLDKSPRSDGPHPRVLKDIAEEIVEALMVIFQESLESGK
eukprot:g43732.t1